MYKKVETKEEFQIAKELHQEIFSKEGFIVEEMSAESVQYLFYNEEKNPMGLVEFTPYNPNAFTTVENDFAFSNLEEIKINQSSTWEIDKLGFLTDFRGKGHFADFINCMMNFAKEQKVTRYVALLESLLYRLGRIAYSSYSFKKVGKSFIAKGDTRKVVPVIFYAEDSIIYHDNMKKNKTKQKN